MFKTVTAKLHTMRKAQDFIAQPMSDGRIMVQSDKSIGMFDPATGKGQLCTRGSYLHSIAMHGLAYEFPAEFVAACAEVVGNMGETTVLGGGVVIVKNTVQVIE